MEMVKEYIQIQHGEYSGTYNFVLGSTDLPDKVDLAGLLDPEVDGPTLAMVYVEYTSFAEKRHSLKISKIHKLLMDLWGTKAIYGFDGYSPNGCGSNDPFILVLDTKEQTVYGIDLTPCNES
ncbi:hypothetical protein WDW86_11265 [Bdellovibrionota bacterium FG-2]